jgi:hypothetical protein
VGNRELDLSHSNVNCDMDSKPGFNFTLARKWNRNIPLMNGSPLPVHRGRAFLTQTTGVEARSQIAVLVRKTVMEKDISIRLTEHAKRAGCAAKHPPGFLLPLDVDCVISLPPAPGDLTDSVLN